MNLNDRNLSYQVPSQVGNDVALLQFELSQLGFTIPEDEKLKGIFGIGTHRAVVAFQRKFGSKTLNGEVGIVDSLTAALMTEEFNKLLDTDGSRQFVLRGTIIKENGIPASNLTVKAYDVDLRNEEELGSTTTDTLGRYEISYSSRQFSLSKELKG